MNPNTPRPGHLFFTPRTPWGTRAGQQIFRQHQRASEDSTTAEKKALDQMKEQAERARSMAANNVPGSLKPTGSIPGSAAVDRAGVPLSLQGQISPGRAEDIRYASQEFPKTPRMPKTASEPGMVPASAPQQTAPHSGPFEKNPTMEDLKKSGGIEGAISMPEPKIPEAPLDLYWGRDFKGVGKKIRW